METKIIINSLRACDKPCTVLLDATAGMIADHLEKLESEKENLIHYNADLNNQLNKAESHIEKLKKQLSEQQPEWISVEDERKPDEGETCIVMTSTDCIYNVKYSKDGFPNAHRIRYWMHKPALPEPPKPKEPTFKDKFLEAFPKAPLNEDGFPVCCIGSIFPQMGGIEFVGRPCDGEHEKCWNQPYFEGEGEEGEADA